MDDTVYLFVLDELVEGLEIADVHLHKLVVRLILYISEVLQITCIGKLVEIDDIVLWIFIYKEADYVRSYKAGPAGDYYITLHITLFEIIDTFFQGVSPVWNLYSKSFLYLGLVKN